jgi:hypothetical protein
MEENNSKKYQIFISFKKTDEKNKLTDALKNAEMLYQYLTNRGFRVFFSEVAVVEAGGIPFNRLINNALGDAQILIAVTGTNVEHLKTGFVRDEWEGFYGLIRSDRKPNGRVFVYTDETVDPVTIPVPLCNCEIFKNNEKDLERLGIVIKNALQIEPIEPGPPPPGPPPEPEPPPGPQPASHIHCSISEALCQEAYFFENAEAIVLLKPSKLITYNLAGKNLYESRFPYRIKSIHSRHSFLVIISWEGIVLLLSSKGQSAEYDLSNQKTNYCIPGDVTFMGENVLIGGWNGEIYQLNLEKSEIITHHTSGIQKLIADGHSLYLFDLSGELHIYQNSKSVFHCSIEPVILHMRIYDDYLLLVCREDIYQFSLKTQKLIPGNLRIKQLKYAFDIENFIAVVNAQGESVVVDNQMIRQPKIKIPVVEKEKFIKTDSTGRYFLFQNERDVKLLYNTDKRIFHHEGVFCMNQDLTHAIGDFKSVTVYKPSHFNDLIQKG